MLMYNSNCCHCLASMTVVTGAPLDSPKKVWPSSYSRWVNRDALIELILRQRLPVTLYQQDLPVWQPSILHMHCVAHCQTCALGNEKEKKENLLWKLPHGHKLFQSFIKHTVSVSQREIPNEKLQILSMPHGSSCSLTQTTITPSDREALTSWIAP